MKKVFAIVLAVILCCVIVISMVCCNDPKDPGKDPGTEPGTDPGTEPNEPPVSVTDYRVDRSFEALPLPDKTVNEAELPAAKAGSLKTNEMVSGSATLRFVQSGAGYSVSFLEGGKEVFKNDLPVEVYVRGQTKAIAAKYQSVEQTAYGFKATATVNSDKGSKLSVMDCYYFPQEGEEGVFNVAKQTTVIEGIQADKGFESAYTVYSNGNANFDWFVPNYHFASLGNQTLVYRETNLGIPMIMMRNRASGATLSLSRYQPVIHYEDNNYASLSLSNSTSAASSISVEFPSRDLARKFHSIDAGTSHALHMSVRIDSTSTHGQAKVAAYNAHFTLQNQRIVNTDIDEVYKVVLEDYKVFLHETSQYNALTGKRYNAYGLPWRITIEDGEFGPLTYQAGFIGQQLPAAYNMMLYGLQNNDYKSLQNGVNVIDFWVNDAEFMEVSGIPHIWYDTWSDGFRSYPCFLRMAVDAMEGVFDAYRIASAHGIERPEWWEAIELFADFLVNGQNSDGSWYRCYNYDGEPFRNWDNGIEEPSGNICQSTSKLNTNLPVRFLARMYEFTGDERYKNAAVRAGEFVYANIYPTEVYTGGTCDNPNRVDKESGIYATYCYDALYTLTGEQRWLTCLEEAIAFTMSTVQVYSYPVRDSSLKAAYPCEYGYNDGMSFICIDTTGADNYAAYYYYELFRAYILTGNKAYLKQAEFIQQNTKSIMNWDGALGYKYKSLVAEASTTSGFTFSSASDGAWVGWSSVANIEPIAKMYTNFGAADVMDFASTPIETLRAKLNEVGAGGYEHPVYTNTIADKIR